MICYASRGTTLRGASFCQKPCIQSVELGIISTTLDLVRAFLKNPASSFGTWLEFQRFQFATFQRFGFDFTVGTLLRIHHERNTRATTSTHIDVTFNRLVFKIQLVGDLADGSRPAAVFLRDMCLYDHRPTTACRLAPLFHSMPIGNFVMFFKLLE